MRRPSTVIDSSSFAYAGPTTLTVRRISDEPIVAASKVMIHYGWAVGIALIAAIIMIRRAMLTESGRRTFEQMSLPRFALGGALGGLAIAGIVNVAAGPAPDFAMIGAVFALAGAVSATGTLAIARRAAKRELLHGGSAQGGSLTP